jgi:hypothetical protein
VDLLPGNGAPLQLVPADCAQEPVYPLTAQLLDTNTIEAVEARWFVNYDGRFLAFYNPVRADPVPADPDPLVLTRTVPPNDAPSGQPRPFLFQPYQHPPAPGAPTFPGPLYPSAGILRVVELVVSNSFDPNVVGPPDPLPFRTPQPGFETQVYRWVFLSVPEPVVGCPGDPACCPPPP